VPFFIIQFKVSFILLTPLILKHMRFLVLVVACCCMPTADVAAASSLPVVISSMDPVLLNETVVSFVPGYVRQDYPCLFSEVPSETEFTLRMPLSSVRRPG